MLWDWGSFRPIRAQVSAGPRRSGLRFNVLYSFCALWPPSEEVHSSWSLFEHCLAPLPACPELALLCLVGVSRPHFS